MAIALACSSRRADTPFSAGQGADSIVNGNGEIIGFSEATDGVFIGTQTLIVLDRVQARLTIVRGGVGIKTLRLQDSTTAALLLAKIRGDSVAVWDAFANSIAVVDGTLSGFGRSIENLPAFHSVVGIFSDGIPIVAAVRPLSHSDVGAYFPDSAKLATWDGESRYLNGAIPQWPTLRLRVGGSSAALGPIWARRGQAQARGDGVWIGDGSLPFLVRIDRNGQSSTFKVAVERQSHDRSAEVERRVSLLPAELRDSARSILEEWAVDLSPSFFTSFRVDDLERLWTRQTAGATSDSTLWTVHGRTSKLLASIQLPGQWRLLDANATHAAFAVREPTGHDILLLLPLIPLPQ